MFREELHELWDRDVAFVRPVCSSEGFKGRSWRFGWFREDPSGALESR